MDPALLWLWCRLAATALIRPLAWEPPYAAGSSPRKDKKTKKKKKKKKGKKKKKRQRQEQKEKKRKQRKRAHRKENTSVRNVIGGVPIVAQQKGN